MEEVPRGLGMHCLFAPNPLFLSKGWAAAFSSFLDLKILALCG